MRADAVRRWIGAAALPPLLVVMLLAGVAAGCDVPSTGGLGQVVGSGTPETTQYEYTGFSGVRVDAAFDVTVTREDDFAVSVTVDDNIVEHLRVEVDGDTLRIGLDDGYTYNDATLTASVTMPRLNALEVSGAAKADVSGFASGDPLDLGASGGGSVVLSGTRAGQVALAVSGGADVTGQLEAQEIGGEASGAGVVTLEGMATTLRLEASGAGELELGETTVQDADLQLSGGATATVRVTGTLNVEASGGATLDYYGSPTLGTMEVSGGAEVNRAGP